jgi:hypothetical protein
MSVLDREAAAAVAKLPSFGAIDRTVLNQTLQNVCEWFRAKQENKRVGFALS